MEGAASASEARGSERVSALTAPLPLAGGGGPAAQQNAVVAGPARGGGPTGYAPRAALLIRRAARRLPPRARRVLRVAYYRSAALAGQLRRRWHRSLQLRVIGTTMMISVVVVAALGYFLMQQIATGLLNSARTAAATPIGEGAPAPAAPAHRG